MMQGNSSKSTARKRPCSAGDHHRRCPGACSSIHWLNNLQFAIALLYLGILLSLSEAQTATQPNSSQNTTYVPPRNAGVPAQHSLRTVVTVTGQPLPLSLTPASVGVVDDSEVRESHALTSSDLLRDVPFVNLEQNGSSGSLSTLTIRGGKPNLVLVLIDGIPVNDLTNLLGGAFDFSTLLTQDVERIEVVSGPLSSGYGSEAMSGVINVITRPSHYEPDIALGMEAGSFGTAGVNVRAEGSHGPWGYKTSGAFLRVGDQVESDAFSTSTFSAVSDYTLNSKSTLSWTARWIQFQDSSFPPNGGGPELSILQTPETSNSGNILGSFAAHHQFGEVWTASIVSDVFSRGEHSYTPPILASVVPSPLSQPSALTTTRFTRPRLTVQNIFNLAPRWQAHFSLQGSDEIGSNDTLLENQLTTNFSTNRGIVNGNGDLVYFTSRVTAMTALGVNKTAGFSTQVAPRVGAALTVTKNTIVKASWGQAYRVPDLYALENPSVGNPNLLPEKVNGMDAGVQHRFGNVFTLSGTYYYNLFSNLIDFSSTTFRLVNRTHVRTEGVEAEALVSLPRGVQISAWGSSLDWTIASSTEPLRDVPDWQTGLRVNARLPRHFRTSATTLWVGSRYDYQLPAPNIDSVGGYSATNLILAYDGLERIGLFARVDNLFNSHFHEYLGFPNPGVACRVGVTYHLR
jgi:vitamin B12 transporter